MLSQLIESEEVDLDSEANKRRLAQVRRLVRKYKAHFPGVTFEIVWNSRSINAQAVNQARQNLVLIYGGLARRAEIKWQGMALAICHEIGHLRRGGKRMPGINRLRCECSADLWLIQTGLPKVFGDKAAEILQSGANQLARLRESLLKETGLREIPWSDKYAPCRLEMADRIKKFGGRLSSAIPQTCV